MPLAGHAPGAPCRAVRPPRRAARRLGACRGCVLPGGVDVGLPGAGRRAQPCTVGDFAVTTRAMLGPSRPTFKPYALQVGRCRRTPPLVETGGSSNQPTPEGNRALTRLDPKPCKSSGSPVVAPGVDKGVGRRRRGLAPQRGDARFPEQPRLRRRFTGAGLDLTCPYQQPTPPPCSPR